jgi:hypothetical protein
MGGYEVASLASRFAGQDTNEVASICSTGDTEIRRLLSKLMRDPGRRKFGVVRQQDLNLRQPIDITQGGSDKWG